MAIGEAGVEELLTATVAVAANMNAGAPDEFKRIIVDTTVHEKAVAFPSDSRLLEVVRAKLVVLAQRGGVVHKQTYQREGKRLRRHAGGYAHAKQYKRLGPALKRPARFSADCCATSSAKSSHSPQRIKRR
ncbi:hypothetical protein [Burkholderia territorii]|uniref:hypothetical protein n=1 Tax=Burkholderia territorii TaxID=1503055 RepID=UPI0012D9F620|nr:hypothetical protein [Burkholderia territorii]